ncbi:hypothetical protein FIBSPDRAFT_847389 [Athelia psychrophila]|uniref:Uncharacterized protein n=1 Tax=Athelia psychrophila TaxID=1759441 RepID=A0A166W7I1_9AGAM|nr:hypothetical protein FIBSPDRAFT_847389 [Fibularhizoctonia sp. CBS 109695]
MAKALGSSVEQEHRDGLHKLSRVYQLNPLTSKNRSNHLPPANKRPSRLIFHRHRATGGH